MLHQLRHLGIIIGLYRDDGLAISDKAPDVIDDIEMEMHRIFAANGLKIITNVNRKIVEFLDVTLDVKDGSNGPHHKPNSKPIYVQAQSNHPPSVLKNIPISVNLRLNALSSSEENFSAVADHYQEALNNAGYKHLLKYEEVDIDRLRLAESSSAFLRMSLSGDTHFTRSSTYLYLFVPIWGAKKYV